MTVTEIAEISKSRSRIYIDREFAFVLYKGELRIYGIAVEKEIEEAAYRQILEEVLPKRAKLRCMNLLKSREYTRAQLADKLKLGGYPGPVIEEALDYVASYRYIDDARYALSFITYNSESKSRRRMENDLLAKGIPAALIQKAFDQWAEEGNTDNELEQAQKLLLKKHFNPEETSPKEYAKLYAGLQRKGYSPDTIRKALKGTNISWQSDSSYDSTI